MVKSREDSVIEIWDTKYINRNVNRLQEVICATHYPMRTREYSGQLYRRSRAGRGREEGKLKWS